MLFLLFFSENTLCQLAGVFSLLVVFFAGAGSIHSNAGASAKQRAQQKGCKIQHLR